MSCFESWVRSFLHPPIRSLEQRYETPIAVWPW